MLLTLRGFGGYPFFIKYPFDLVLTRIFYTFRSIGLFGMYYSLQYLSLSDATVLTFFIPTCAAISGAIFLGESFKLREAIASCMCFQLLLKIDKFLMSREFQSSVSQGLC